MPKRINLKEILRKNKGINKRELLAGLKTLEEFQRLGTDGPHYRLAQPFARRRATLEGASSRHVTHLIGSRF